MLRQGSIVWAQATDGRGNTKRRPVIILNATEEIQRSDELIGVAVTTTYGDPPKNTEIELPWFAKRHPRTGLTRRSAAACDWLVSFPTAGIEDHGYFVPSALMAKIVAVVSDKNAS